jgi:hypothetical protein
MQDVLGQKMARKFSAFREGNTKAVLFVPHETSEPVTVSRNKKHVSQNYRVFFSSEVWG